MEAARAEKLSRIYAEICLTCSLPWITDFPTEDERKKYISDTYDGATLKELLEIGIDPFM